ncbi:hypothetical protein GLAREA_04026 [Glarea lozoyensis ATCC 20868]|uniref:Uncharacterized protein n=1 Tax=Glarea lozoyensis (strain ATCC 20868 / MF5171) TaxID=1116229 RepID=S3D1L5_GLAL2|nr:uncharacterized protein GLAREA_04026 [Glarea lozoyensis ATCC 20868]EPE31059.1 hypothetical protein GLAREA_04026 [Glarea lozoyensis ATCC 20868]
MAWFISPYLFITFLATVYSVFARSIVADAELCTFAFDKATGKSQRIQSPFPGADTIFQLQYNGMYAYEVSTGVFEALFAPYTYTPTQPPSRTKHGEMKRDLDFSQAQPACGQSINEKKSVYAKFGKVALYLCNFDKTPVSWADVKEQMGRLNAECVHGQSGMTGMLSLQRKCFSPCTNMDVETFTFAFAQRGLELVYPEPSDTA